MKKLIVLGLSLLAGNISIIAAAAESTNEIILLSNDNQQFKVSQDVVLLSETFKHMIKDLVKAKQETTVLETGDISGATLGNILLPLMQLAHSIQPKPFEERLNTLTDKMKGLLAKEGLEAWQNLLRNINYLDIETLKNPLANGMIQKIYQTYNGDREKIQEIILSLNIPDEFKGLLAKHWYLNYGKKQNFILPIHDYGFSIKELATYNKLPKIRSEGLFLDDFKINDLTGLQAIPGITNIKRLYLSLNGLQEFQKGIFNGLNSLEELYLDENQLETLPQGMFNGPNNLRKLHLQRNQLKELAQGVFNGLNSLEVLVLDHNKLEPLPLGIFNGLNNLQILSLVNNQLKELPQGIFNGLNSLKSLYLSINNLTSATEEELRQQFGDRVHF